ncbi:hypothetical protein AV274_1196 [Blastocystis sp. ATCC 50177/Nand II]|uniref:Uncharacterized protein n=1 Tax=Blastocystis sp. subtype 1 (strain ATCC 50177 / NandII) TaxID=478820 RepID=A0A196SMC0_BLAHN|nr:hypothetical protein AV274_1196 [Blastocystis sp. ATCC 50177/Nand II]
MEDYYLWILAGGVGAILLVLLSYMGFFSKMACNAEETDEMILAYTNIEAPYAEMEKQSIELRKKLKEVLNDESIIGKGVNVYYDDPRFSPEVARWAVGYMVPESVLDILALNSISYVRIPAGKCLVVKFPYRNVFSYGLGARKAFDTMVQTANAKSIVINTPPMVVYGDELTAIRYILYLNHADIIHSMCDSPFDVLSASM